MKFRVSETAKVGDVVDQDPAAQTQVEVGSTVTIWVAKEPPLVPVPVFTDLTLADAQSLAIQIGVNLVVHEEVSDTVPVGTIISQDPAPGTEVPKGSDVQVVVSTAPQLVTLPNVTCLSYGAAKGAAAGSGARGGLGRNGSDAPRVSEPEPGGGHESRGRHPGRGRLHRHAVHR